MTNFKLGQAAYIIPYHQLFMSDNFITQAASLLHDSIFEKKFFRIVQISAKIFSQAHIFGDQLRTSTRSITTETSASQPSSFIRSDQRLPTYILIIKIEKNFIRTQKKDERKVVG